MTEIDKSLIKEFIGIDSNLAIFLDKYPHTQVFTVDGVMEILGGPFPFGWKADSFEIKLAKEEDYPLDPKAVQFLSPYRDKPTGLGWEIKQRVAFLERATSDNTNVQLVFSPTTYEEGKGFHQGMVEALEKEDTSILVFRERLINQIMNLGRYSVPGIAVVHTIVVTSDNRLILCQRSPHTGYHPSRWSISFEEQITQKDLVFGNAALSAAAVRGLEEEFASGYNISTDAVHILGIFLEYNILNIGFCVYIETPQSFDEIKINWEKRAKDRWEAAAVVGEPFTLENIVRLLRLSFFETEHDGAKNKFHPSSKYRLLLAAMTRFGSHTITNALKL